MASQETTSEEILNGRACVVRNVTFRNGMKWFVGDLRDSLMLCSPVAIPGQERFLIWICSLFGKGQYRDLQLHFRSAMALPGFAGVIFRTGNPRIYEFIIGKGSYDCLVERVEQTGAIARFLVDPRGTKFFNYITRKTKNHEKEKAENKNEGASGRLHIVQGSD